MAHNEMAIYVPAIDAARRPTSPGHLDRNFPRRQRLVANRRSTMTLKSKIAALAAVLTVVADPAFTGDQDTATELRDSGRDVPERRTPVRANACSGAYASVVNHARSHK